jgi:hypothetical protein
VGDDEDKYTVQNMEGVDTDARGLWKESKKNGEHISWKN